MTTIWSRRPSTLDLALGGMLTALMLGELVTERAIGTRVGPPIVVGMVLCVVGLAVAARNVAPFTAFVVNGVGVVAVIALGFHGFHLPLDEPDQPLYRRGTLPPAAVVPRAGAR